MLCRFGANFVPEVDQTSIRTWCSMKERVSLYSQIRFSTNISPLYGQLKISKSSISIYSWGYVHGLSHAPATISLWLWAMAQQNRIALAHGSPGEDRGLLDASRHMLPRNHARGEHEGREEAPSTRKARRGRKGACVSVPMSRLCKHSPLLTNLHLLLHTTNKQTWRLQDSNFQSLVPKTNAFSIRPQGPMLAHESPCVGGAICNSCLVWTWSTPMTHSPCFRRPYSCSSIGVRCTLLCPTKHLQVKAFLIFFYRTLMFYRQNFSDAKACGLFSLAGRAPAQ